MVNAFAYVPAIVLLPFFSFLVALGAGRYLPKGGAFGGIAATAGSFLLSIWVAATVAGGRAYNETLYYWASEGGAGIGPTDIELSFGVLIDPLSALMLVIVTLVALLVHVFSLGYMNDEGETGLPRYYAGLGLFTASMLGFVVADNLLMAFMFFELVGLCSYLLIGFNFREPGPPSAAKKAFLVTRFGDYFFLVGVVAVFATFGTAQFAGPESFPALADAALNGSGSVAWTPGGVELGTWLTVVGLLVLGGVVGKSAQFPLHTWLPDAMEGPTPVSALIHAATMVAAGVYLVARMYGFYVLTPTTMAVIAFIGGFTALFAATMGLVKNELKQVLAYSTISQYGYMMLALGAGGYVAAVFHLTTHAFFKALLFLGAGSVIIAMHHNEDMWDMGGLKSKLPVTYYTFLAGSLALAGIFPFAGFWSKDEILYEALVHGLNDPLLLGGYLMGLLAVPVTAFYTFRMVFLTFHGEPRSDTARDPVPVRWNVKGPLTVLGSLAVVTGFINMVPVQKVLGIEGIDLLHLWLDNHWGGIEGLSSHHYADLGPYSSGYLVGGETGTVLVGAAVSLGLALLGLGLAWRLYNVPSPAEHTAKLGGIKDVLYNNYYLDELQVWLAYRTEDIAGGANVFDQGIIDGVVNGVSSVSLTGGGRIRQLQSGIVSQYAALLTFGLVALLLVLGATGGWFL
ncbi:MULTISPECIES: NADH-quinone oxidoreductase subunit L [Halorubrum]|uniref:NADH-quinone oxidoreductase subunit L n=1 Tax=Halorubrum ezzemoulense TaxID=337243 RepID=A0A256JYN2_HALEZ|nr:MULTISPECIES: NADH-quinone oxidoreductase subunit L [Halorubrum]MDB2241059.1 NADH-quinone oxidoreductase subunit L [Halorubrum ezzemoulense]OTF11143.1 NADH-quinone oxidoreductase subunit L [Halorubrum sp. SD612]OYR63750.1 NADH-quinone oxidoreductase subunit L [Halorubrum ezzemoulense]OYR73988.1 NADH-quinone oxidoreductase subunit L [Halorubrum ezzemoulense]TKX35628.1 NADH-quinone oxidoreductase subunit L [Halorubrum sp. CGM5_25_10-8B]